MLSFIQLRRRYRVQSLVHIFTLQMTLLWEVSAKQTTRNAILVLRVWSMFKELSLVRWYERNWKSISRSSSNARQDENPQFLNISSLNGIVEQHDDQTQSDGYEIFVNHPIFSRIGGSERKYFETFQNRCEENQVVYATLGFLLPRASVELVKGKMLDAESKKSLGFIGTIRNEIDTFWDFAEDVSLQCHTNLSVQLVLRLYDGWSFRKLSIWWDGVNSVRFFKDCAGLFGGYPWQTGQAVKGCVVHYAFRAAQLKAHLLSPWGPASTKGLPRISKSRSNPGCRTRIRVLLPFVSTPEFTSTSGCDPFPLHRVQEMLSCLQVTLVRDTCVSIIKP